MLNRQVAHAKGKEGSAPLIDIRSNMSSPWLRDYVLEGLGFEIRQASPHNDDETSESAATPTNSTTGQARLVHILDRGQGRLETNDANRGTSGVRRNPVRAPPGSNWWEVNRRGKSPNLAKYTDAWILVSDGSHSARLYLTVQALKEIFEWDSNNNNEDNLFGRGCCVLLKKYSLDCGEVVVHNTSNRSNKDTATDGRRLDHDVSVQLKVASLEPKPGFNHHHGPNKNHANRNDNNVKTIIQPVMEETDVLYGLQFLARQRHQQQSNSSFGNSMSSADIARDWDVAFGRLSNGQLSTSKTTNDEAESVLDGNRSLNDILELAEKAASTEEAIREWETAKKEFAVIAMDATNTHSDSHEVEKPMAKASEKQIDERQDGDQENNDQEAEEEEEDHSRMYIQNILANSDDEEEREGKGQSENEKDPTSQKEYECDNDENLSSDSEGHLLPETQPNDGATSIKTGTPSIPSMTAGVAVDEEVGVESVDKNVQTTTKMRRKRPRANSFESGTASNLTLDEAITGSGGKRKPTHKMRRKKKQQLVLREEEENSHDYTGLWESMKEQLFDPSRTILYCVPSYRMLGGSDSDGEKMLVTPKKSSVSTPSTAKPFGSAASIGTNFTSSTPNPSSGAYYRKFGLARWLSQNTVDEE